MKPLSRMLAAGVLALGLATPALAVDITGAGATFPYPIYAKWADAYKKETGAGLNYQSIGSGGGIKQIQAKTVTFGASDMPLKAEELQKAGLVQFPTVLGGVVPVVNIDGMKQGDVTLDGPTLAKIFMGEIKTWNDPAIAKLNAGVSLPSAPISVFFRSDESGTTENFTKYLKAAGGGAWTGEPAKKWTGTGAGKEKSAGVAEGVKSTKNSITYVEWSYAVDNKLTTAQIDTGSGTPVELSAESAGKALAAAKPAGTGSDLALKLDYATKAPGAYPIILATYEIACTKGLPAEKTALVKSFLSYFVSKDGQSSLTELNYAPLPAEIQTKVDAAIQAIS